jgi:hypothetical protein
MNRRVGPEQVWYRRVQRDVAQAANVLNAVSGFFRTAVGIFPGTEARCADVEGSDSHDQPARGLHY